MLLGFLRFNVVVINPNMFKIPKEVKVVGMHCPSCVNAVQLSLTDVDGIDDAKADLDSGITKVTLDTDKVSDADIKEAVEEAGFNVE